MDSKDNKQFLFIWDCDYTISNDHTLFNPAKQLFGEETMNECKRLDKILYAKGHEYFLDLIKEKKIPNEKVLEAIDKIPLNEKIKEAFEVIKKYKNKCQAVVLTSNLQLLSEEILRNMGYIDLINAFIGIRRIEIKENEHNKVYPDFDERCSNCKPNPCKVNTFKAYIEHNHLDYNGFIKIFICDGGNDLCFAKTLGENDFLLARKGFGLMKRIDKENRREEIKATLEVWENGEELAKLIEKIIA